MNILGKTLMGATAATALAVAAPAQARDNGGIDGGDILVGALLIGGVAAVIAAVSDDDDDRYDNRRDVRYNGRTQNSNVYGQRNNRGYGHIQMSQNAAVNTCSAAAQQRASRYGRAQVTQITDVDRNRNGYEVEGRVVVNEGRSNNRRRNASNNYDQGRFTCRITNGRVDQLRVRGIG